MAINDMVNMSNGTRHELKQEDDDIPLAARFGRNRSLSESSSDDDIPLAQKYVTILR